ncbi:hypothetical protein RvY_16130 [Ramazzottius varieornatus]|uniref:SEA domain-containing protein n=1 Tax=Ramazzottius varieornatus TaxID=947166 RepID=A0A1D1W1V2_RAMVA|nr:hypothetical protein RvY_16130 [Ramazzottius varieornatus]
MPKGIWNLLLALFGTDRGLACCGLQFLQLRYTDRHASLKLTVLEKSFACCFFSWSSQVSNMAKAMWFTSMLLVLLCGLCLLAAPTVDSSMEMASGRSGSQESSAVSGSGSSMATSGTSSIEDSLLLAYSTQEERDRNIEWIRRLWAFIFHTDVRNVRVLIIRDIPLSSGHIKSKTQGHNVSYSVTSADTEFANSDTDTYRRQFQEMLPASTSSYLVTFPQGQIPDTVNMTVIDQIRSPSSASTDMTEQENVKTFMLYDTISFSYRNMAERNRVLEIIRRAWETAFGDAATNVDLVVHQDMLNADGTHQLAYVITVLTTQMDWNVQQLESKVRQVLSKANIPSLIILDTSDSGSTTPFSDNGVRSFVFYDTVTMTYSTDAQKAEAVETLRKTWQDVFGSDAWNVQVSVYAEKPASTTATNAHRVSYSIMFSSQNKTDWNFETLKRKFLSMLGSPTIKTGNGFSFVTMKSQGRDLMEPNDDSADDEERDSGSQEGGAGSDDTTDGSDSSDESISPSGAQGRSLGAHAKKSRSSSFKSTTEVTQSKTTKSSSSATEHYFLSDAIQVEYSSQSQRDQLLELIRSMWADLLGNSADDVQISLNDDFARPGSKKRNIIYHILVESSQSGLDLKTYVSRFWSKVSKSDNALLQSATRVLTLPYIQGSLDLNAVGAQQQGSQVSKKGSVSYRLPHIKGTLDLNIASISDNSEEQTKQLQEDRTGSKKSRLTSKLPYIKGSLKLNVATTSSNDGQSEDQSDQHSSTSNKQSHINSQSSSSSEMQHSSENLIKFSIQDTQIIAYTTSAELERYLDSLRSVWIQVLGGESVVSNVEIKVIMDISAPGAHAVTYKITGFSTHRFDVADVMVNFLKSLQSANFIWIMTSRTKSSSAQSQVGAYKKSDQSAQQQSQSSSASEESYDDSDSDSAALQAPATTRSTPKAALVKKGDWKSSSQSQSAQKSQQSFTISNSEDSDDSEDSEDNQDDSDSDSILDQAPATTKSTTKATTEAAVKAKSNEQKSSSSSKYSQKQHETHSGESGDDHEDSDSDSDSSYGQIAATTKTTAKATTTKPAAKIFFGKAKNNQGSSYDQQSDSSHSQQQAEESNDNDSDQDTVQVAITIKKRTTTTAPNKIFFNKDVKIGDTNKYQSQSSSESYLRVGAGQVVDTFRDAIEVTAGPRRPWMVSTSQKMKPIRATVKPQFKAIDDSSNSEKSEDSSSQLQMESSSSMGKKSSSHIMSQTSSSQETSNMVKGEVTIRGALSIRYSSKSEREAAVEDIKKRWLSSDALGDVENAEIKFISEIYAPQWAQLGADIEVHSLAYIITGTARRPIDLTVVRHALRRELVDAKVDYIVVSAQKGGNDETIDDWAVSPSGNTASKSSSSTNGKAAISTSESSSSQTDPFNTYVIYDTLSIRSNDDDEIAVYIDQVQQAWQQVIGNDSDHHLSIYDNQTSGSVQTMKYLVVIFSSSADLNLTMLKSQFVAIKPSAAGSSQSTSSAKHSNAVVLRESISFSYDSEKERDDFVDGIEKLWQNALGRNFQLVEAWLFDELIFETSLESEKSAGKTFSQLSYAVVVVSDKYKLSAGALQASFQQYVITKSVSASKIENCGFQDVLQ